MEATDEQKAALDAAGSGDDVKIVAYAGSGKTTTLRLCAQGMPARKGLYLAFNKAIVADVQAKFPASVEAKTFHSLAYRHFGRDLAHKLSKRLTGRYVAEALRIDDQFVEGSNGEPKRVAASSLGYYLMQVVSAHCRSAAVEMHIQDAPLPDWRGVDEAMLKVVRQQTFSLAGRLWAMMRDPKHDCPATHDVYAKLWVDSDPKISGYDYILFDEAQDADPLMLKVVLSQSQQKIWVGDPWQQIYGWRGAINAMASIDAKEVFLTQSFRFGEAVAERANVLLTFLGATRPLRGNPARDSKRGPIDNPTAILHRTNASTIEALLAVLDEQPDISVSATGTGPALAKIQAIAALRAGHRASGEFSLFKDYSELREYAESESGGDLRPFIEIERDYGAREVEQALRRAASQKNAALTLSVAHQAKGLEWSAVQLGDDFRTPQTEAERTATLLQGKQPMRLMMSVSITTAT